MVKREVLASLLDSKKTAILKVILNSNEELTLNEIAKKGNVSIASTFRLLQEFTNLDFIEKKVWKNSKVYTCKDNEKITFLKDLFIEEFDGIQAFVEASSNLKDIQEILLHQKNKNKANLLLIGKNIDQKKINQIVKEIKNKGFELSYVLLSKQQYEQMAKMGIYSGEEKVLK
jgi:Fe2+ or Zn2+ uptake regulation protein